MKLTLIRTDRETGKESFSILETDALMEKIKKENKAAHISALRFLIPVLQGGTAIQEIRRYASFIGTSNQKDLLTDPSGSRRFICIEVTGPIRTNVSINYRQLYAQAMSAISKGERYWLDDSYKDERPTIHQQSSPLRTCTPQARNQQPEKKQGK